MDTGKLKTDRAKTHRLSISAFPAIICFEGKLVLSLTRPKFLNWGDHVNSVPDLAANPPDSVPWFERHVENLGDVIMYPVLVVALTKQVYCSEATAIN